MGRDVPAIIVSQYDRRRYRDKVRRCLDVFARMLKDARFKEAPQQVGLEAEFYLVDGAGDACERGAEVLDAIGAGDWAPELGKFNLEVNLAPRPLADEALGGLERDLADSVAYADGRARGAGARLAMIGILPTLRERDTTEEAMSPNPRYYLLNEQMCAARGEEMRIAIEGPERLLTHVRQHHAGGRLHQRAAAPAGHPGGVRQLLERRPGGGRDPGGGRRQLAVPVRQGAVAREPDPAVPAGHRHQAGGTPDPGGAAAGLVR